MTEEDIPMLKDRIKNLERSIEVLQDRNRIAQECLRAQANVYRKMIKRIQRKKEK